MSAPYYITTAIAYPNGRPHIGHAYEAIGTDAIARFQRLMGRDVCFLTGTDEHGLKMDQTARAAGKTTIALADEMSLYFRDMYSKLNISNDHFCRTTAKSHHLASQALWNRLVANDDLYLDQYQGYYSVRDEAFYDDSELTTGEGGAKLSPQGTPVEWTTEETWFFRLSKYQKPLLELYAAQPDFIRPDSRRNETIKFVEGGLRDLSVSRTSFDWGVKVPGSANHIMYVWLDALTTYISGIGFPDDSEEWRKFWPADVHIIGKDIVRFHAVYWPAFLMSAGLPLPKQIFGHGFLLSRGEKMSKSLGNVVDPLELSEIFGVDSLRYFLMREVGFGQDGSYSAEAIVLRVNAELANSFGNLAQRTLSFIAKNLDGLLPSDGRKDPADDTLLAIVQNACANDVPRDFSEFAFSTGLESWMRAVYACNQYIDVQAPWALRKTDPERMMAVLETLLRAIRALAIAVQPVIPKSANIMLDQLGVAPHERDYRALNDHDYYTRLIADEVRIAPPTPIFPRLEMPPEAGAAL
jgi:methionyl-tRNA synthetase